MNDKKKQQLMVALFVFNFTLFGYVLYHYFNIRVMTVSTLLFHMMIGSAIGLFNGTIAYFVGGLGK